MFKSELNPGARTSARSGRSRYIAASLVAASLLTGLATLGSPQEPSESPRATRDRVNEQQWWPTKGTIAFSVYAGENSCSACHSKKAATQVNTPMGRAATRLGEGAGAAKLTAATEKIGNYSYQISSDRLGSKLTVSSGKQSIAAKIAWIFGMNVHGETYILTDKDTLYESQVSSFAGLQGMDLTPGHSQVEAGNLKNALGELLTTSLAARCFACHTTYSSTNSKFDPQHAVPGIHCEACHGPGLEHIRAIRAGKIAEGLENIFNPANISPVQSVDFCGACHRTSLDVVVSAEAYGPINVRFQPYRLEKSRCWGTQGDDRLTCVACHDPHEPLAKSASFYDQKCLSCHVAKGKDSPGHDSSPAACPKATANCTSCHMPKSEVRVMHAKFTDHFIRVVRAGESYPN
jgi:hypothetical protein